MARRVPLLPPSEGYWSWADERAGEWVWKVLDREGWGCS